MQRRVILTMDINNSKKGDVGTVRQYGEAAGVKFLTVSMDNGETIHVQELNVVDLPVNDPIRQEIVQLLDKQFAKGVVKYGATLHENPLGLSTLDMIDYLSEELMDGIHYIRKLRRLIVEDIERGTRQTTSL